MRMILVAMKRYWFLTIACWTTIFVSMSPRLIMAGSNTHKAFSKEPRTGISFDPKMQNLSLEKVGVRTKGPIKVYAIGQYGKTNPQKPNNAFVLKMNMNVSREKLSTALMDALETRCRQFRCETNQDIQFKEMLLQALPAEGATSGSVLTFNTSGNKVTLTVNGKMAGKIIGRSVAKAFAAIYTDNQAVCVMKPAVFEKDGQEGQFRDVNVAGITAATVAAIIALWTLSPFGKKAGNLVVGELNVYPIKSCAEQSVDTAVVTRYGFKGDRIAMVVDSQSVCCTSRDVDKVKLFHVQPKIDFPECKTMTVTYRGSTSNVLVPLQNGNGNLASCSHNEAPGKLILSDLGSTSASWMAKCTGIKGCRLMSMEDDQYERTCLLNPGQGDAVPTADGKAPVSLADEAPFLLTNQSSLEDLNIRLLKRGQPPVDMRRFRPNMVLDAGAKPWIEDTWKKIRIGNKVEFFVWQRCGRCIMTTIDRDSLTRAPKGEPLSTLNTFREGPTGQRNFGMHLIPDPSTLDGDDAELTIRVGDEIEVLEYDHDRLQEWEEKFASHHHR